MRPGRSIDHPPQSSAEDKERVDIALFPLWAFVACSKANFTFTVIYNTKLDEIFEQRNKSKIQFPRHEGIREE
jgi:hypothetical protein